MVMKPSLLPRTPRELSALPLIERTLYDGLIAFVEATGLWTYPMRAYGDLERMRFIDKVYWMYKTTNPIRRARRGSGLEAFFDAQRAFEWRLPDAFAVRTRLRMSSVGDLINHPFLVESRDTLYTEIDELVFDAEVSMANLECPIVRDTGKEFTFAFDRPPPLYYDIPNFSAVKGSRDRSFTFMATACNHSLDFGPEGLDSTIAALRDAGIAFHGINGAEADADRATVIEKGGFKIGVVAYTFGLNAFRPPADRPRIVNVMKLNDGVAANDFRQLTSQIAWCRSAGVDFIVAHLHWGLEHELYPIPEQVELAHHVCELGIDAIIGHHPHVIQPVEHYRTRRDPRRVVPIFYSLGNLVNFFSAPYLRRSGVARIDLAKGTTPDGAEHVYVERARLAQVVQVVDEGTKTIHLERAEKEERA